MLTRVGCHLCDEALEVADRVCAEFGADLAAVDVDSDEALREEFSDLVPVTFVDSRRFSCWGLDATDLRTALAGTV